VTFDYEVEGSGEILTLSHEVPVKKRRPKDMRSVEPFAMIYGGWASAPLGLTTGSELRVLLLLTTKLQFNAPITLYQVELGEQLHLAQSNVSRAITGLRRKGFLIVERGRRAWLNPTLFWKGTPDVRIQTIDRLKAEGLLSREDDS
jgi:biotin operon repressor